jgi:hypothetical protein
VLWVSLGSEASGASCTEDAPGVQDEFNEKSGSQPPFPALGVRSIPPSRSQCFHRRVPSPSMICEILPACPCSLPCCSSMDADPDIVRCGRSGGGPSSGGGSATEGREVRRAGLPRGEKMDSSHPQAFSAGLSAMAHFGQKNEGCKTETQTCGGHWLCGRQSTLFISKKEKQVSHRFRSLKTIRITLWANKLGNCARDAHFFSFFFFSSPSFFFSFSSAA